MTTRSRDVGCPTGGVVRVVPLMMMVVMVVWMATVYAGPLQKISSSPVCLNVEKRDSGDVTHRESKRQWNMCFQTLQDCFLTTGNLTMCTLASSTDGVSYWEALKRHLRQLFGTHDVTGGDGVGK